MTKPGGFTPPWYVIDVEGAFRVDANTSDGRAGSATGTLAGPHGEPLAATLDVALAPSIRVEGTVRAHGSTTPVPGATVTIRVAGTSYRTSAGVDGRYTIPFVRPGTLDVSAEAPAGYDRGRAASVVAETPGQTYTVDVEMDGVATVAGTARSSNGVPLTSGTVVFTNDAWGSPVTVSVPVQSNGAYELADVPVGAFTLRLTAQNDPRVGVADGTLAAGQTLVLDVQLESAGTVRGAALAVDGVSPAPAGVDVTVRVASPGRPTHTFYTHTNSQGHFVVPNVPLGTVSVSLADTATGGVANATGSLAANGAILDLGTLTLDNTPVRVVSVSPADGATNVSRDTNVTVTFSEPA